MRNDQSLDLDFSFGELALEDTRDVSAGGITKLVRNKTDVKGMACFYHYYSLLGWVDFYLKQ